MPRNGDGSSDNGPIEGQEVVHGASGDVRPPFFLFLFPYPYYSSHVRFLLIHRQTTLQHAKNNVAPMPEIEKGEGTITPHTLIYRGRLNES
jgi:hypothetical protein